MALFLPDAQPSSYTVASFWWKAMHQLANDSHTVHGCYPTPTKMGIVIVNLLFTESNIYIYIHLRWFEIAGVMKHRITVLFLSDSNSSMFLFAWILKELSLSNKVISLWWIDIFGCPASLKQTPCPWRPKVFASGRGLKNLNSLAHWKGHLAIFVGFEINL